jgi:uncharacterized protein YkwD
MKPFKHPLIKTILKSLPLLFALAILSSFFTNFPQTSINLLDQTLGKIGLIRLSSVDLQDQTEDSPSLDASPTPSIQPSPSPTVFKKPPKPTPITYYTGVELWQELQEYRRQHGVPEFQKDNTLCTIASIRVNQLLDLKSLDGHDGFSPEVDKFRDNDQLTHHNVAENILSGYPTAKEAIAGWDSSLGHQSLMQDGSYVYACAAANSGFAVLIAAY